MISLDDVLGYGNMVYLATILSSVIKLQHACWAQLIFTTLSFSPVKNPMWYMTPR